MKFKIGLALGFAAGYWWANTTDEERKARFDELVGKVRDNPRIQQVTDSVTRDARRLTDAAQARVTHTADRTSEAVAGKVDPAAGKSSAATGSTGSTGSTSKATSGTGTGTSTSRRAG